MERMISIKTVSLLFFPLLLLACSTPIPRAYAPSTQHKMQSAHHWDVLAADVVDVLAEAVQNNPDLQDPSFFVKPMDRSPFAQGFRELLMTQMVARGFTVQKRPSRNDLVIETNVAVLRHLAKRNTVKCSETAEVLSSQVLVFRGGGFSLAGADMLTQAVPDSAGKLKITENGGKQQLNRVQARLARFSGGVPHTEVIITSALLEDNRYLARFSDIYYINMQDSWHYEELPVVEAASAPAVQADTTPELKVKGSFN